MGYLSNSLFIRAETSLPSEAAGRDSTCIPSGCKAEKYW